LLLQIGPMIQGKTVPNRPLVSYERFVKHDFVPTGI